MVHTLPAAPFALPRQAANPTSNRPAIIKMIQFILLGYLLLKLGKLMAYFSAGLPWLDEQLFDVGPCNIRVVCYSFKQKIPVIKQRNTGFFSITDPVITAYARSHTKEVAGGWG
jgi:hypothetical protein